MPHRFDPTILREYDIRGIVGQTLSAVDAQAIGGAFARTVKAGGGGRVLGPPPAARAGNGGPPIPDPEKKHRRSGPASPIMYVC